MKEEIYVSCDVESDGPIPGENSMLSLGAAAFTREKENISEFDSNLNVLPGASPNPDTMAWWAGNQEAWEYCRKNQGDPKEVMEGFSRWLDQLRARGKTVCVCYPAGYDFTFIYWYLMKFVGRSPFGFQALDIKSYAMAKLGTQFRKTVKANFPKEWFDDLPHTHKALDDAREQGAMFINILNWKDPNDV